MDKQTYEQTPTIIYIDTEKFCDLLWFQQYTFRSGSGLTISSSLHII